MDGEVDQRGEDISAILSILRTISSCAVTMRAVFGAEVGHTVVWPYETPDVRSAGRALYRVTAQSWTTPPVMVASALCL